MLCKNKWYLFVLMLCAILEESCNGELIFIHMACVDDVPNNTTDSLTSHS